MSWSRDQLDMQSMHTLMVIIKSYTALIDECLAVYFYTRTSIFMPAITKHIQNTNSTGNLLSNVFLNLLESYKVHCIN